MTHRSESVQCKILRSYSLHCVQVVHKLTKQGLRILACAHKFDSTLSWHSSQRLSRDKAERDVNFVGLLLMENRCASAALHTLLFVGVQYTLLLLHC